MCLRRVGVSRPSASTPRSSALLQCPSLSSCSLLRTLVIAPPGRPCLRVPSQIVSSRVVGTVVVPVAQANHRHAGTTVWRNIWDPAPTDGKRRAEDLTPRELEILRLIWEGHTNRSIAACLKISMKTADIHRANMMKKLRASNTAQLLKAALKRKLLQATDARARSSEAQ